MRTRTARPSKYRNVPVVVDGVRFDSKREARRWCELLLAVRTGLARDLRRQVPYDLHVGGQVLCRYVADFVYVWIETGERIVEDVKGVRTPVYQLKRRAMLLEHGIAIKEV